MKAYFRIIILALLLSAFSSCTVDVDWDYYAWSEVKNETAQEVTLTTVFPMYGDITREKVGTIPSGESLIQYAYEKRSEAVGKSKFVSIKLLDGTEIVCVNGADDPWSSRFFGNKESRKKIEWSRSGLTPLKHEVYVETYHIDNELISLWREAH